MYVVVKMVGVVLVSLSVCCLTKYLCLVFSNPMFSPLPYLKGLINMRCYHSVIWSFCFIMFTIELARV